MGLKGYRLWVMGQLDSTCSAPPLILPPPKRLHFLFVAKIHVVAVQVAFVKAKA
jgi:hypothetical protein